MTDEEAIKLGLTAGEVLDRMGSLQFFYDQKRPSRLGIENGGFPEQSFKAGMPTRRRIERRNEGFPMLFIERENSPIR